MTPLMQSNADLLVAQGSVLEGFLNNGSINTGFGSDGVSDTAESTSSSKATIANPSLLIALESGGDIVEASEATLASGEAAVGVTRLTPSRPWKRALARAARRSSALTWKRSRTRSFPRACWCSPTADPHQRQRRPAGRQKAQVVRDGHTA
jgi:hypothetical protein